MIEKTAKNKHMSIRHEKQRENMWPGSGEKVWTRHDNDGFTTIPRVLPLVMHLITILDKSKSKTRGNASRVYFDLWCRVSDEGFVEVTNDEEFAYSSGYASPRAVRTWRESVFRLREAGFVEIAPNGHRDIGFILLLDPLEVVEQLHEQKRVPEGWWNAFLARTTKIKALLPSEKREKRRRAAALAAQLGGMTNLDAAIEKKEVTPIPSKAPQKEEVTERSASRPKKAKPRRK